jgi:hypothetical protein
LHAAFGTLPLSASDWLICSDIGRSVLWLIELKKLALCLTGRLARPFGWRINSAATLQTPNIEPGSDTVPQLLNGRCAAR